VRRLHEIHDYLVQVRDNRLCRTLSKSEERCGKWGKNSSKSLN